MEHLELGYLWLSGAMLTAFVCTVYIIVKHLHNNDKIITHRGIHLTGPGPDSS